MSGPRLIGQLRVDYGLNKKTARQVAYFADLADAGKTFAAAQRASGLSQDQARRYASQLGLSFAQPDAGDG